MNRIAALDAGTYYHHRTLYEGRYRTAFDEIIYAPRLDEADLSSLDVLIVSCRTDPAVLASIDHEVYGSFAEMDNGIPPEQVNEFVSALQSAGVENDVHVYDEVNHGFWLRIDGDPELLTEPGLDAWQRLREYLRRTLSD